MAQVPISPTFGSFAGLCMSEDKAGSRASTNSCWSMQSRSQARQQTMNTNHW